VATLAVVLTGAPGAGKPSVLQQLADLLEGEAITFGALDSEQLAWGAPWLDNEPWLAQLRAIFEIQRRAGRSRFLAVEVANGKLEPDLFLHRSPVAASPDPRRDSSAIYSCSVAQ
jgi:predicted ATPase